MHTVKPTRAATRAGHTLTRSDRGPPRPNPINKPKDKTAIAIVVGAAAKKPYLSMTWPQLPIPSNAAMPAENAGQK